MPAHPDVPAVLGALLAARQKALDRKDSEDAAELRREIGNLGYVVRDEGDRQHWRAQRPVA